MKLKILGSNWGFVTNKTEKTINELKNRDGACCFDKHKIYIQKDIEDWIEKYTKRHEIVHAFFYEAGRTMDARDEELVSLIAMRFQHLIDLFNEVDAL